MDAHTYIPQVQVRSKGVILYDLPDPPLMHRRHDLRRHETYTGTVTDHAAKRIKRTVDVFLQKSPTRRIYNPVVEAFHDFRLSFITLTISANERVSGKDGREALKVFIQHFRRKPSAKSKSEQLTSYLWKAELQERGQLHYHITANRFLHYVEIQGVWNGIQKNRGWLDDFYKKEGRYNANSTDVHAVYKVQDIQAYLSKYLAKQQFKDLSECGHLSPQYQETIGGKVWDCSQDLKIPRFSSELDSETDLRLWQIAKSDPDKKRKFDRCTFIECNPAAILSKSILQSYEQWKI